MDLFRHSHPVLLKAQKSKSHLTQYPSLNSGESECRDGPGVLLGQQELFSTTSPRNRCEGTGSPHGVSSPGAP